MSNNPFPAADVETSFSGRYVIGAELRVGGQGVVYRATRLKDQNGAIRTDDVALKLHLDANQDERVEREIQVMRGLTHPCLATLLEEGHTYINGIQSRFIAWQYIEGEPLDARLLKGALNQKQALVVGIDIASAVDALWAKHIVHRDINPKNIILTTSGRAILIDLGGARHLDNSSITAAGMTFGTVGYFSPEQFRAERALTCASDVFALAVVLIECLLGQHPTKRDQYKLVAAPIIVDSLLPSVSPRFSNLLSAMLSGRAAFRPSVNAVLKELESVLKEI